MSTTVFIDGARAAGSEWTTRTWKALLLTTAYTGPPDPTTERYVDDVSANELTGTGYARATLGTLSEAYTQATNSFAVDCADLSFGSIAAGETAGWVVVYEEVTTDADSPIVLMAKVLRVTNGTAVTITVSSAGLLLFQAG